MTEDYKLPEDYVAPGGTLVGVDGNAFSIIAHVSQAMRRSGQGQHVNTYADLAMSGDYYHLIRASLAWLGEEED